MNTKHKGDLSTARVLGALLKRGFPVLVPFGDNQRYDLVFDQDGSLHRIQVKTGSLRNGAIRFPTSNQAGGGARRPYHGEIEFFGVYCLDNDKSYLVPIEGLGSRECSLRVDKSRNGQTRGVRFASDFEL